MAEEFFKMMNANSEAPLKERVEGLADVIEKIMQIVLKIPEMTDVHIQVITNQMTPIFCCGEMLEEREAKKLS